MTPRNLIKVIDGCFDFFRDKFKREIIRQRCFRFMQDFGTLFERMDMPDITDKDARGTNDLSVPDIFRDGIFQIIDRNLF